MRAIAPRTGAPETTIAENQEEYKPITVALYQYETGACGIVTRWTLTAQERAAVAGGADIYVNQLHFSASMTPLSVHVGADELPTYQYQREGLEG